MALRLCGLASVRPRVAGAVSVVMVLLRLLLKLGGTYEAEIVFGVLEIVFSHHPVACGIRIPGELKIFLIDMSGGAANFDLRAGGIEGPVGIVLRPAAASARAFHWSPFVTCRVWYFPAP